MAGNIFNEKDSMDINELASLNEDISPELIEQLQKKIEQESLGMQVNSEVQSALLDDVNLFEEIPIPTDDAIMAQTSAEPVETDITNTISNVESTQTEISQKEINNSFDDNFIKKYKAKLRKQSEAENAFDAPANDTISDAAFAGNENAAEFNAENSEDIGKLTHGNIVEKPVTQEQKSYNDSLDFLDGNVKYSKYVIYIDPQNVEFIEGLTVKERKNLINKIIKEQEDITITKHRFQVAQTILKHVIIAILTITISIPVIYYAINASLEASINNYRRSQTNFKTLYKEKGKIKLHNQR